MKRLIVILGLVLRVPAPAHSQDSSLFTPTRELRFGVSNIALKRAVSFPGSSISYGNASLRGLELVTMGAHGGGIRLRYETGSVPGSGALPAAGKVENLIGNIVMGTHDLALVAGYRLATLMWNGERQYHMPEVGFEGGRYFVGAGVLVKAAAMYRRMLTEAKHDSMKISGLEGRTSVLYVPPRGPVYIELGYRREVLAFNNPSSAIVRREEQSAVVLSLGIQTGLSVR
jgi:hypothetical protein